MQKQVNYDMKTYGGLEVELHYSWYRQQLKTSGLLHSPVALAQGKSPLIPVE
jgi:hypothetical protein